jgi:phenylacetate-coenzyme A ligase PaaK-like adenylate-forming protein
LRQSLAALWGCEVFEHYGMTEMGLGGGVDCAAHAGYHLRESDLLIEVVDPESGDPVAPGEMGEVVFTTLKRRGMPLIRYRTGDLSRLLPGACACGSPLARLSSIKRRQGGISLGAAGELNMSELDEALFALDAVADFGATFRAGEPPLLQLEIAPVGGGSTDDTALLTTVYRALAGIPQVAAAEHALGLRLSASVSHDGSLHRRVAKRRIAVEVAS